MRKDAIGLLAAIGLLGLWLPGCTEETSQLPFTEGEVRAAVLALQAMLWIDGRMATDLETNTQGETNCESGVVQFFPASQPPDRPEPAIWSFLDCVIADGIPALNGGASADFASEVDDGQGTTVKNYVFEMTLANLDPAFSIQGNGTLSVVDPPAPAPTSNLVMAQQGWAADGAAGSIELVDGSFVANGSDFTLDGRIPFDPDDPDMAPLGSVNTKGFVCEFPPLDSEDDFSVLNGSYAVACELVPFQVPSRF